MSFMHEYRKFWERKCKKHEKVLYWNHADFFSFRLLHSRNWKLAFYLSHVYILGGNHCADKWHGVFVSQHNKFHWNEYLIMQKDVRYWVSKFIYNNSLFISPFLWRALHLITSISWNHQPYLHVTFFISLILWKWSGC